MLNPSWGRVRSFLNRKSSTVGGLKLPNVERLMLTQDYLHTYRVGSFGIPPLSCRVRVYVSHPRQQQPVIVLYSAMTPGSITNWAEDIATYLWRRVNRPDQVYFVEHWPVNHWNMSEFMLVQFQVQRGRLIKPQWSNLRRAELEAVVHGSIEALVG